MQQNNDKKPGLSWSTPAQHIAQKQNNSSTPSTKQLLPAASAKTSGVAMYAGMFVGGLIVGVLIAWSWSALRSNSTSMTASSTDTKTQAGANTSADTGATIQSSDLVVTSPQKAGQSVTISDAEIGKPTWVVVYEDRDGAPGNILGAQLFFESGPGIVTLLRGTEAGKTYYVGMSTDNGDRKFTKATDKAEVNLDGSLSVVSFKAN